ncbi:MAG: hypothetical protein HRU70_06395 [Phycisphaeraceae bacterium]|nr:MAG: hypothetical protein HRU70_06395 [Phycisphaeraceae bacterium]
MRWKDAVGLVLASWVLFAVTHAFIAPIVWRWSASRGVGSIHTRAVAVEPLTTDSAITLNVDDQACVVALRSTRGEQTMMLAVSGSPLGLASFSIGTLTHSTAIGGHVSAGVDSYGMSMRAPGAPTSGWSVGRLRGAVPLSNDHPRSRGDTEEVLNDDASKN